MKKIINTTEEKKTNTSLLKPFPFNENEEYLLKLENGQYVIAYWGNGQFFSEYSDNYVEEEIESIVALKDLRL